MLSDEEVDELSMSSGVWVLVLVVPDRIGLGLHREIEMYSCGYLRTLCHMTHTAWHQCSSILALVVPASMAGPGGRTYHL